MRAHRQQHALDIGVVDDGDRAGGTRQVAALGAVMRKAHGFLVSAVGNRNTLHAHGKAGGIHHDEHVFEAAIFFADQVADSAAVVAELQHGGRAGLDAELVLDAHAMHVVARAQAVVVIDQKLGNYKQRDTLDAFGRARHTGQHQVNDVPGHVVFAVGDVDFGTKHFVGAIFLRLGAAAHGGQV